MVEEREEGVWLIRTATVIPDNERWLHAPAAASDLNNALTWSAKNQKQERHAALDTLNTLRQVSWNQLYRDSGLKWEKISSVKFPAGIDAIYSLRITQSRRATAFREGDFMRLLKIAPDHDSTSGRK